MPETPCGRGSTAEYTLRMRAEFHALLVRHEVECIVDAGCGDFNWMRSVDLTGIVYLGLDRHRFSTWSAYDRPGCKFRVSDIVRDPLPPAHLVMCRDVLFHLSLADCTAFLLNFKRSGSRHLLMTTIPGSRNADQLGGGFTRRDFTVGPFNLPCPRETIPDGERLLGLWHRDDLQ